LSPGERPHLEKKRSVVPPVTTPLNKQRPPPIGKHLLLTTPPKTTTTTTKTAGLFQRAFDRGNHELQRLSLVLRRARSPLTGRLHVGLANLSADAPARAVGTRYSHAQREFFARVVSRVPRVP
jgi:hypothetical protein